MHVMYISEDDYFSILSYTNGTWGAATQLGTAERRTTAEEVSNFVAIAPYVDPTQIQLYYLLDHILWQFTLRLNQDTGQYEYGSPIEISAAPGAIQAPALIAAAGGTGKDVYGEQPQISVFYVWKFNDTESQSGVLGSTILNVTDAQGTWVEDSWNAEVYMD